MKAIAMTAIGGPEVLALRDIEATNPGPGEVLVRVAAAGVNFMDIGVRRGMAWNDMPLPRMLGVEGAGQVLAVGEGVSMFRVGDRVAWVYAPGSYAGQIVIPVDALVAVPDGIDDKTAAGVMMQGLTASHFTTDFYPVQKGDVALIHAAAGGLGLLMTQIIKSRGGRVIGRVSHESKVAVARGAGADHVIVDRDGRFADAVLRLTDGVGVDVVYDGSGPVTFDGSLASLRRAGTFCWYGPVLGGPGALDIMSLPKSIKIGYAVYMDHVHTPELLRRHAGQLFTWILNGDLDVHIGGIYPLADAARAHTDMESRTSTGKLILVP
jgi:NADPH2:quinone reductase